VPGGAGHFQECREAAVEGLPEEKECRRDNGFTGNICSGNAGVAVTPKSIRSANVGVLTISGFGVVAVADWMVATEALRDRDLAEESEIGRP
jgi:hypothetical protein